MRRIDRTVLLVGLVAAVVHAGSLGGEFLEWDDALLVWDNPRLTEGGLSDLGELLTPRGARSHYGFEYLPVRDLSNRLDHALWGLNPVGYHLGNVLLLGIAAAALYGVLLLLLRSRSGALVGALIFAVHPGTTESVACIAHRKDVLMAAFGLVAWLAWLRDRRLLAIGLFVLAVLSKLPAIALPGVFLIADLALRRPFDRRRALGFVALAVVAGGAVAVSVSVSPALGAATWHGGTPFTNALSVGVAFLETVRLLLFPVGLHVGRVAETMTRTSPDAASVAGLVLLAGLLAVGVVALVRQRRRPTPGGLVLVLATLGLLAFQAPYLQVRPFWVLFAERYLILAVVPLALGAGYLVSRLPGTVGRPVAVALLLPLAALTVVREQTWSDTVTLFTDAYEKEPRSYIALDKVGRRLYLRAQGLAARPGADPDRVFELRTRARTLFRRSIAAAEAMRPVGQALLEQILVNSRQDLINVDLELMQREPERLEEARREAETWVRGWPDSYLARAFRGYVAHKAGRLDVAETWYDEAIRMAREQGTQIPMALHNLGLIYRGRYGVGSRESMELFERAVAFDPGHVASWEELARGHDAHGRWEAEVQCLESALRAAPGDRRLAAWLAAVLRDKLHRWREAQEVLRGVRRPR